MQRPATNRELDEMLKQFQYPQFDEIELYENINHYSRDFHDSEVTSRLGKIAEVFSHPTHAEQ